MKVDDSSELGAAFERHRGRLTAIAGRILGDAHEAQDVVQEGFLRWQGAAGRDGIRTPAAWLTTVVQNLAIDRLRQRERAQEAGRELALLEGLGDASAAAGVGWLGRDGAADGGAWHRGDFSSGSGARHGGLVVTETPEDVLARLFELSAVFALLRERLSATERIVFVLHEACEREHEEIARLLRISEANSRQVLHRARKRLAKEEQRAQEEQRCRELVHEFHLALHRLDVPVLIGLLSDAQAVSACAIPATDASAMLAGGASAMPPGACATPRLDASSTAPGACAAPGLGASATSPRACATVAVSAGAPSDLGARDSAAATGLGAASTTAHARWARRAVGSLLASCLVAARAAQTEAVAAVQ